MNPFFVNDSHVYQIKLTWFEFNQIPNIRKNSILLVYDYNLNLQHDLIPQG
jgi:hypothetical protein